MKHKYYILLLWIVCLCGCTKISVEDRPERADVTVWTDWNGLDVTGRYAQSRLATKEMNMKFDFYPLDGGAPLEGEGTDEKFTGSLPAGDYLVLTYNKDVQGVAFTDMDNYLSATAHQSEESPADSRADGLTIVDQPSMLYAGSCTQELVVPRMGAVETVATMRQLTRSLRITFKMDKTDGLSNLAGHLNGVCRSVVLATGEVTESARAEAPQVAVDFDAPVTDVRTSVQLAFFGLLNPENGDNYNSTLDFTLKGEDGWEQETTVDLTDPVTDIVKTSEVELDLELPSDIVVKVEYTPTSVSAKVESWTKGDGTGTVYGK